MQKKPLSVGFQGEFGAYSEIAAEAFGEPAPFPTFENLFNAVLKKQVDCAAVPITNAIAGVVKENAELLWRFQKRIKILAESMIPISHCLLGMHGSTIKRAREVHSHWQALAQCQNFFQRYKHLTPVETYDTAGSAKQLAESGDVAQLVIASERAAERYGLRILKRAINDMKQNRTKFFIIAPSTSRLVLSQKKQKSVVICKSLQDVQPYIPQVLSCQAIPTRKKPFEVHYLIEVQGEISDKRFAHLGTFEQAR
ncbi:MAG: prephenate dehydratase domain-containing protein [Chloroherpetonaceae bacterium]